jgi:hypothetical protein
MESFFREIIQLRWKIEKINTVPSLFHQEKKLTFT